MSTTGKDNRDGKPILLTGGQDGSVRQWDGSFECVREFNVESVLPKCHVHSVRALALHPDRESMAVGTLGGEIVEVWLKDGLVKPPNTGGVSVRGHNTQIWAMAVHPKNDVFVTAADDALLRYVRVYLMFMNVNV
jgi:WD40 repeat protein